MKKLLKSLALASFVMVGALAIGVLVSPSKAVAQDQEQPAQTEETSGEQTNPAAYEYTTQQGDSYTKIARKAVQTYGVIQNISLSQAQIVAAETFLTQSAGSPSLTVGQAVTVNVSDVEAAVKKAQALTPGQLKLWEAYVPFVNFDTNNVGQSQA